MALIQGSLAWMRDEKDVWKPVRLLGTVVGNPNARVRVVTEFPVEPGQAESDPRLPRISNLSSRNLLASQSNQNAARRNTRGVSFNIDPQQTGKELEAMEADLSRMDAQSLIAYPDMIDLAELTEASVLYNLRLRFHNQEIYTSIAGILLSTNPFQPPSPDKMNADAYRLAGSAAARNALPPHVFALAHDVYDAVVEVGRDQSLLIAGESGSGKTELARLFLGFFMDLAAQSRSSSAGRSSLVHKGEKVELSLQDRINSANPVLEAFGNARTMRNDNSSRFGRWLRVSFNPKLGSVVGGNLKSYLLEKSRVCSHANGERNFHIFYQLLSAARNDPELAENLQLGSASPEDFAYLTSSSSSSNPSSTLNSTSKAVRNSKSNQPGGRDTDARDFQSTMRALRALGFSPEEEGQVLQILAGLLNLGNVEFTEDQKTGRAEISRTDVSDVAAELLGLDAGGFEHLLLKKDLSNAKEAVASNRNAAQARAARDAVAKHTYAKLFDALVERINLALQRNVTTQTQTKPVNVGLLDIFGFEVFDENSLEQLCINFANEKLQSQFFRYCFEIEKQEYLDQGVPSTTLQDLFPDETLLAISTGSGCLPLFEDRALGIWAMLEDEVAIPKGTDASFVSKLLAAHAKSSLLSSSSSKDPIMFRVSHYAGTIDYCARDFLDKSRDRVEPGIEAMVSSIKFLSFADTVLSSPPPKPSQLTSTTSQQAKKTLGTKFQRQLEELVTILDSTELRFARCLKPNNGKLPGIFDSPLVLQQLRYSGVLAVVRVRARGFPVRLSLDGFAFRYTITLPPSSRKGSKQASAIICKEILQAASLDDMAHVGKDLVLMRKKAYDSLEISRDRALKTTAIQIQKVIRGFRGRLIAKDARRCVQDLERLCQGGDLDSLREALGVASTGLSQSHPAVVNARKTVQKLEAKEIAVQLCMDAENQDEAERALQECNAAGVEAQHPALAHCHDLIKRGMEVKGAKVELRLAMEARDVGKLGKALARVRSLPPDSRLDLNTVEEEAVALQNRLTKEKEAVQALEATLKSGSSGLMSALKNAEGLGLESHPAAQTAAKKASKHLRSESQHAILAARAKEVDQTLKNLREAMASQDWNRIELERKAAYALGLDQHQDVKKALELVKMQEQQGAAASALGASIFALRAKAAGRFGGTLTFEDVENLIQTSLIAKQRDLATTDELREAIELEKRLRSQLRIQRGLEESMTARDFDNVRQFLLEADDFAFDNDLIRRARAVVTRRAPTQKHSQTPHDKQREIRRMSTKEFEQKRLERMSKAKQDQHIWTSYSGLRTREGFGQGGRLFSKVDRDLARSMCRYTGSLIPRSMTEAAGIDERVARRAVLLNKAILGFCGDISLPSFPSTLAQQLLEAGLLDGPLADELWVQLLKQTTHNPSLESERRAWILIGLAANTVLPSNTMLEDCVLNFFANKIEEFSSNHNFVVLEGYAKFALRKFEHSLVFGGSGVLPTAAEVQAYLERAPSLVTVTLADGSELVKDHPTAPDTLVEDLVETICAVVGIRTDLVSTLGLFADVNAEQAMERKAGTARRMQLIKDGASIGALAGPPIPPPTRRGSGVLRRLSSALKLGSSAGQSGAPTPASLGFPVPPPSRNGVAPPPGLPPPPGLSLAPPGNRSSISHNRSSVRRTSISKREEAEFIKEAKSFAMKPTKSRLKMLPMPEKSPEPLVMDEHIGDIMERRLGGGLSPVLVLRRVFVPRVEPPGAFKDEKYLRVCFLEALEEVLTSRWGTPRDMDSKGIAAEVAQLIMFENGAKISDMTPAGVLAMGVMEFLPTWCRQVKSDREWAAIVAGAKIEVSEPGPSLQRAFMARVSKLPTYGTVTFHVRRGQLDFLLGIGSNIMLIDHDDSYRPTWSIPHIRVKKVVPFAESFALEVWSENNEHFERISLVSSQARVVSRFIWDAGVVFTS